MSSLSVVLSADVSGFSQAIKNAKDLLEQYSKKNKELADQLKQSNNVNDQQVESYRRVIKQLEKTQSGTMSTTQQEKVLTNQIKELKIQWQNLSETAKSSDFGKAMSSSIKSAETQLKQLRTQMKSVEDQMEKSDDKVKKLSGSLSGDMLSSITSLISKFALLAGSQQLFDRLVNSNQGSADTFAGYMYAAKTAVDEFFYSISTGDWTAMSNGLNNLISRAKEAAAAVDQLGNTIMSYSVVKTETQDEIARLNAIIYDPKSTKEQVEQAEKDMKTQLEKFATATKQMKKDTNKKLLTDVGARANMTLTVDDLSIIHDALTVNAKDEEERLNEINKYIDKYKEYEKEKKELDKKFTVNSPNSLGFSTPTLIETDEYKEQLKLLQERNPEFRKAIVYNALLNKASDEQLQTITDTYNESVKLNSELSNTTAQIQRITNRGNNRFNITTPKITEPELKVKPIDLTIKPIDWGRTEKEIDDEIAEIRKKIRETPEGALRIKLQADLSALEEEKKNFGKDPIKVKLDAEVANIDLSGVQNADLTIGVGDKTEILKKNKEGIDEVLQSSERLYSVWKGIGDSFESGNVIEKFFAIADAISTTIDSVQNLIQGFEQVGEAVNTLSAIYEAASQRKIANDSAETASNVTKASSAASAAVAEGTHKAVSSSKHWIEAIAAISAIVAAITAALSLMGTFSNGGIVGKYAGGGIIQGATSIGDYNLARVNSSEMILNKGQQGRLFRILNGELNAGNTSKLNGEVEFRISGQQLIGVLRNYENRRNKII